MPPRISTIKTYKRAHQLRHETTESEARLWSYLRAHRLNSIHFRRQYAIGKYVVDFCAPRQKLIIEVDGSQHLDREEQDKDRATYLTLQGYRILRFWNDDVMNNLEGVIIAIEQALLENQA